MNGEADDRVQRRVFDALGRIRREKVSRHIGLVTDTSPFTVTIGGQAIEGLSRLDSYTPTLNDRVWVSRVDGDLVVHGKLV